MSFVCGSFSGRCACLGSPFLLAGSCIIRCVPSFFMSVDLSFSASFGLHPV